METIIQIFLWQSPKGCCWEMFANIVRNDLLLFALTFDNGLADSKFAFKRFSGNNPSTSCPKLMNFRPIILEFMLLKRAILPRLARNVTMIFIRHVVVPKRIGKSQF